MTSGCHINRKPNLSDLNQHCLGSIELMKGCYRLFVELQWESERERERERDCAFEYVFHGAWKYVVVNVRVCVSISEKESGERETESKIKTILSLVPFLYKSSVHFDCSLVSHAPELKRSRVRSHLPSVAFQMNNVRCSKINLTLLHNE